MKPRSYPLPYRPGIYRRPSTCLLVSVLWVGSSLSVARALNPPDWTLESPGSLILEEDGQRLEAPDGFVLQAEGVWLIGEGFWLDQRTGELILTGPLAMQWEESLFLASAIEYSSSTESLHAEGLRVGRFPIFAEIGSARGDISSVQVSELTLFPHEPRSLSPFFRLREGRYDLEPGRFSGRHATLGIGRWPLLYWPSLTIEEGGLLPSGELLAGSSSRDGISLGTRLFLPVNARVAPGGDVRAFSERGVLLGPGVRYRSRSGDDWNFAGDLQSGWINDRGDRGEDRFGQAIDAQRGYLLWSQVIDNREDLTIQSELHLLSDSEVVRDFRQDRFPGNEYPISYFSATWQPSPWQINLFSQYDPNRDHTQAERLPEIILRRQPFSPADGWLIDVYSGLAVLRERGISPDAEVAPASPLLSEPEDFRSERLEAGVSIEKNLPLVPGWVLTPGIGSRVSHYQRPLAGRDDYTRILGELSLTARGMAQGTFANENKVRGIDGLRHRLHPEVGYLWIPRAEQGQAYIPPIDRRPDLNRLPSYRLAERSDIDLLESTHLLRFGLGQYLETRDPRGGTRQLASLGLTQNWHLTDDPRREDRFAPLQLEAGLQPFPGLSWETLQRIDLAGQKIAEGTQRIAISDRDEWAWGFSHFFRDEQFSLFGIDFRRRLNERFMVLLGTQYEAREGIWPETTVGLRQTLQDTWDIDYGIRWRRGDDRSGSFSFTASAQLLNF